MKHNKQKPGKPSGRKPGKPHGKKNTADNKSAQRHKTQKTFSRPKKRGSSTAKNAADDSFRLNKYLAHSGVCSRREADTFIAAGLVTVNGETITELGYKVKRTDKVQFEGQTLHPERYQYLLLNKPKGFITTLDDPEGRKTVMDLVKNAVKERIYPVGRLDKDTTGVLLFTNDGQLAKRLTHPSYNTKKIYHVSLNQKVSEEHITAIRKGIELEDGFIKADDISYVAGTTSGKEVGIEIHSGRNRIVRRIFEHFGYKVVRLDRVLFGPLTKKNLPRGHWRMLTKAEINMLMVYF